MLTLILLDGSNIPTHFKNCDKIKIKKIEMEHIDYVKALQDVDTKYVQFITSDVECENIDYIDCCDGLQSNIFLGKNITNLSEYIFETEKLKEFSVCLKEEYYNKLELIAYARKNICVVDNTLFDSNFVAEYDTENFKYSYNKWWYDGFFEFAKEYDYDSELILYLLMSIFQQNKDNKNKHLVDTDIFLDKTMNILKSIQDDLIFELPCKYKIVKEIDDLNYTLLKIKYGSEYKDIYLAYCEKEKKKVLVDLIEYKDGLNFECTIEGIFLADECRIFASVVNKNGGTKEVNVCEKQRFSDTLYFGKCLYKKRTFSFSIKKEYLNVKSTISIIVDYNGIKHCLEMYTNRFTSKISSTVRKSYWIFDKKKSISFVNNNKSIIIKKASGIRHIGKEISLLFSMMHGNNHSISMVIMRCLYWLTRPFFYKKNIWITYDKPYKAGDCGEYIYKYIRENSDDIDIRFVINGKYKDAIRLKNEGHEPLLFGTLKQRLYYLNASIILTTHAVIHNYNGFNNRQVVFVQDLIFAHAMFIQHGLSVQEMAFDENRVRNDIKRYYVASNCEVSNLSQVQYDYDKEQIRLTGIPRYDGLKNCSEKMIMIAPTWRQYIVTPSKVGESRPYFERFKEMDYYKIYDELLSDKTLIDMAKQKGYKIKFILHPIITNQKKDFVGYDECVDIIAAADANYEELLTKASVLVTDYSGIQFDFAYMRKPLVYYHPDKLPAHYTDGAFHYDTMAFGDICKEKSDVVKCICSYMQNGCEIKKEYKEREDEFFAYNDYNNCRRIFEDVYAYQRENM